MRESRRCFVEDKYISFEACEEYKAVNDLEVCDGCEYVATQVAETKTPETKPNTPKNNTLMDLNNHLFAQIDKLSGANKVELSDEIERSKAVGIIAKNIIDNAKLALEAEKELGNNITRLPPMIGDDNV